MGLFSPDSILMRGLNMVANIVILHFLWLLYSIPLVTIGASTTALYYTTMKLIRTGEGYLYQNFRKSFRENLKQSTILWLVMLLAGFLFVTDIRYGLFLHNTAGKVMIIGCSVFLIPFLLVSLYIFPIQAKFENTIFENVKLALLMSLRHILFSLLLILIIGTIVFLGLFFQPFMGVMLICGAGITAYFTSNIFIMIFRKYIPDEVEKDLEKSGNRFE
ncbi:MAG: YesL family protein [Lachnospiraceae bacterium]|nr:YesL family protein [Lachnospiraceae bacterium]